MPLSGLLVHPCGPDGHSKSLTSLLHASLASAFFSSTTYCRNVHDSRTVPTDFVRLPSAAAPSCLRTTFPRTMFQFEGLTPENRLAHTKHLWVSDRLGAADPFSSLAGSASEVPHLSYAFVQRILEESFTTGGSEQSG